jgi:hypothetical protein
MVDALERVSYERNHDGETADNLTRLNSCSTNDDESEDIVSFTEILNRIGDDSEETHYGNQTSLRLKSSCPNALNWKGSSHDVRYNGDGETTFEPLLSLLLTILYLPSTVSDHPMNTRESSRCRFILKASRLWMSQDPESGI